MTTSSESLLSCGKALFIGAHPDDIEFYCGGTVHLMRERGTEVVYAIATRGGRGRKGNALKRLEQARAEDQMKAAKVLGVERVVFFNHPDKTLSRHVDELARDLALLIEHEKPDIILSWDPDCIYNPHPDHQAAADAAFAATAGSNTVYYGTWEPDLWVACDEHVWRLKLRAIRAHRTETPWFYWHYQKRLLIRRMSAAGARIGARYAEAYRAGGNV